jgi:hypothetical protein
MSAALNPLFDNATPQPPRPVRLHIERLAVVGLPMSPTQSRQFGAALELELKRLACEPGWPADAGSAALPGVTAPAVNSGGTPAMLGRDVARSLFDAVRRVR